jgi:translocation and assembly module TamB
MTFRSLLRGLFALLVTVVAALSGGYAWLQTEGGKRWLADRIEAAVSAPGSRLALGDLRGAIPFAPILTGIRLSDSAGPWLTLDRAAFRLDPLALFHGEARFETIEVGRVAVIRQPPTPAPEQ